MSRKVLVDLVNDAMTYTMEKEKDKTIIYSCARMGGAWERAAAREPRSLDSVILQPKDLGTKLIADAKVHNATNIFIY